MFLFYEYRYKLFGVRLRLFHVLVRPSRNDISDTNFLGCVHVLWFPNRAKMVISQWRIQGMWGRCISPPA